MRYKDGVAVKIVIYAGCLAEATIYYRYDMPMGLVEKWKWYFEYLVAIVKQSNPRRKVELIICAQQSCLCGCEYVSERTKNLLRSKNVKLKKLRMGKIEDDLFGMAKEDNEAKIADVTAEIEALERGDFNYYVPPTYINKIKSYIKK